MAISKIVYKESANATPVTWMDATTATAAAADITAPKTAMLADGIMTTGTGSGGGGGGSSSYLLLATDEFTVNTSSTTETSVGTITVDTQYLSNSGKMVYVKVRDNAGKRDGYFWGVDEWFTEDTTGTWAPATSANKCVYSMNGSYISLFRTTGTGSGVYVSSINGSGSASVVSRYNSTSSRTINGTYTVTIYLLEWPDNVSPYA